MGVGVGVGVVVQKGRLDVVALVVALVEEVRGLRRWWWWWWREEG